MVLTERDRNIVLTLTHRVKVLTIAQVHRTWWAGSRSPADAVRRIRKLEAAGFASRVTLLASDELTLDAPLAFGGGAAEPPDFAAVIAAVRGRSTGSPRVTPAVTGTARAGAAFGGTSRQSRPSEHTHDLHLSHVYLKRLREEPRDAAYWVGEARLSAEGYSRHGVVPDAIIRRPGRHVAVEVVGASYSAEKLWEFHEHCLSHGLSYELW